MQANLKQVNENHVSLHVSETITACAIDVCKTAHTDLYSLPNLPHQK